jgi:hypothetical protein
MLANLNRDRRDERNTIPPYDEETGFTLRWPRSFAHDVKPKLGLGAGITCKSGMK